MRVMVVSPVRLFRDCLATVLGSMQPVPKVVAEVSITALHHGLAGEQPDVVLLDVTQDIGIEEVALVAAKCPNLPLLALGLLERREEVVRHGRAGFVGYVARDATIEDLQSAISDAVALHHGLAGEQPDVVLLDVTQDIGIEEVALVAAKCPNLPLLALGLLERREEVVRHGRAGFVGYVARDATIEDLQSAISDAVSGPMQCPAGFIRALVDRQHPSKPSRVASMLTKRETEVLQIIPLFPQGGNLGTRSPPDNRIGDPPRATNSRPVGSTPQPSTIDEGKSRFPHANGVKRMDSSHIATGAITALLATALVYLSKWPLQALDPSTASAFAGLLVALGGALVKYYKSRTAVPAPPVASVVPLAPPNLVQEPPAAA